MKRLLLILAFIPTFLLAQSRKERKALEAQQKADQLVINNLKNHVQQLAKSGSSEANTTEYIATQFKALKLQPKGTDGFIQPFEVDNGKKIEPTSFLKVNDASLELNKDFFPLPFSAEKKVSGMPAMALRERGVPWFVDVKDWVEDGSKTTYTRIEEAVKKEVTRVAAKGASALFLYNSGSSADSLHFNANDISPAYSIPVIYLTPEGYRKYFNDHSAVLDIELNVAFGRNKIKGNNVVGYLDNVAFSTIVIAAHYRPFFNIAEGLNVLPANQRVAGADDNASGIATIIELARMLSASAAKSNNYLFIAFDGSDNGSTASNYWLQNTASLPPINYMVNLDMVGTYNENKKLAIHGYNTSPVWRDVMTAVTDKKILVTIDSVSPVTDLPMTFYKRGIPELSFSAANHKEYVTGTDEEAKINYAGTVQIARFINKLIEAADSKGKVLFARVSEQIKPEVASTEQNVEIAVNKTETPAIIARNTVSLGLIPDKTKSESGLKISGVSPRKLAAKLGLQPGDVLTTLGSYKISDMKTYMEALSKFRSGDRTTLRIKRGKDDKEFTVEF